jgi:hypothetical protein
MNPRPLRIPAAAAHFLALAVVLSVTLGASLEAFRTVAWVRTVVIASRTMPLEAALRIATAQGNDCSLETASQEKRRADDLPRAPAQDVREGRKPALVSEKAPLAGVASLASSREPWRATHARWAGPLPADVPVPPPRFAA